MDAASPSTPSAAVWPYDRGDEAAAERRRGRHYPLSRWYLRPAAGRLAAALASTPVRPVHLTVCGLAMAGVAAAVVAWRPDAMPMAAAMVLAYWFFDRADGQLARRQRTVSALGAWLDANVDELVDVGLHVAVAAALAAKTAASWPWLLLIAFLAGKYLFMYGLATEERAGAGSRPKTCKPRHCLKTASGWLAAERSEAPDRSISWGTAALCPSHPSPAARYETKSSSPEQNGLLRRLYHLPGNADVRVHLLAIALATGLVAVELALVAGYYNLRWIVRYGLVARRLGGVS